MSEQAQAQAVKQSDAAQLIAGLRRWARWARTVEAQRIMLKAAEYLEVEAAKK